VTLVKKSGSDTFAGTVQAALTTDASGVVTAVAATPVTAGREFTGTNVVFEPTGFGAGSGCEISIASLTALHQCVAIGQSAMANATKGNNAFAIGFNALTNATEAGGNMAIGTEALVSCLTGGSNTAIGNLALYSLQVGNFSTAVGSAAGIYATGTNNAFVGFRAGQGTSGSASGGGNVAIGADSMYSFTTASNNVSIGVLAFFAITSGNGNVAIGLNAGRYRGASTDTNTSATNSIFIGNEARANDSGQSNQVVIGGEDAIGDGSNSTVLNNSSTTSTRIAGTATSVLRVDGDTVRIVNDRTPATAGAAGNEGDICWDANYIYVCVAANTWKRVAIATWP
jgi:hypothetical protein